MSRNPREDRSIGIVPLQYHMGQWQTLLILQRCTWSFPKGHAFAGESMRQTAERELLEETGLRVIEYFSQVPFNERYTFTSQEGIEVKKRVDFFPALVGGKLLLQAAEVHDARWVRIEDAERELSYQSTRRIWIEVCDLLKIRNPPSAE